jgi:Acetyltransferase (GNAT) domain
VSDGWLDLDGYAAAWARRGTDDPYLRPEYLHAAAAIEQGEPAAFAHGDVLYPFLVRDLGDGRCDITSAYGAGGPIGAGPWREPFAAACRERGVVSEFIRFHPVLENHHGLPDVHLIELQEIVTVAVQADDEALISQMEPTARNKLRKAIKAGVEVTAQRDLERVRSLYIDTMRGMGADQFYFFPEEFFTRLERLGDAVLVLDAGTAAGLFLTGGGAMHYFLTGSTLEARRVASANLLLFEAMKRARAAGLTTLVLGGGFADDDSLHRFKRSIGAGRAPKVIGTRIHDQQAYRELCEAAGVSPDESFFPAYRR